LTEKGLTPEAQRLLERLRDKPVEVEWVTQWLGLGGGGKSNPHVEHRSLLLCADHGGARRLQALALNLYNGSDWPVDMGSLASYLDSNYWAIALDMMEWYRKYGENDQAFMGLCRQMADQRLSARAEDA